MALYHLVQLSIAFILALPVALNREQSSSGAGLRTIPLVGIASCAYILIGADIFSNEESQARILYGIITGIGFIGGGAILKKDERVAGTATAAAIWNTGALGVAVAYQKYEIAVILSLVNFTIFQFVGKVKQKIDAR